MAIPAVLLYFTRQRRDLPFPWMFWMFGLFIVSCGFTHLMEIILFSTPVYRLAGLVKAVTAVASVATVIGLVPLVPRALALRSSEELEREIVQRKRAEAVHQRYEAELTSANAALQKEAAERRHNEERFRLMVDSVKDYAIFLLDPLGYISSWNSGAERIKGYTQEEVLGKHFSLFYPEEKKCEGQPQQALETAATQGRYEYEGWRLRKDGSRFWANVVISAVRDPAGRLVGFTKVTRDLTDRRAAEDRLRASAEELARSNRELQEFASVASHDLQEPLRKIQAFGERLETHLAERMDEAERDFLDRMRGAAQRMSTLITDLLAFSRVTSKAQPFAPVDLGAVAREVLSDLEVRIQRTGGKVELGPLPVVEADPLQMRQLLQNLIGNALKFHRPGVPPLVRLRAEPAETSGNCRLIVEDNGIGFDEKYLDRIFGVFQRLHGRGEYEGTGMGLAIARKISERHGGSITATSRPGAGATFLVTLPLRQPRRRKHNGPSAEADHHPDGR
jgi:PAS domain S-box-containing protein